jgi:hypothetical protein
MTRLRRGERGEGRIGVIISLVILIVLIYLGVKYVPVMINSYNLRDFIEEEARYAAVRKGDEDIRDRVYQKAQDLTLPVEKASIKIQRSRHELTISVNYMVPIETPVFTHKWQFAERVTAPLF